MTRRTYFSIALVMAGVLGWAVIWTKSAERPSPAPELSSKLDSFLTGEALGAIEVLPRGERSSAAPEPDAPAAEVDVASDAHGIDSQVRIYGQIVDAQTGLALEGVRVRLRGRRKMRSNLLELGDLFTGQDGRYEFNLTEPFTTFNVGTRRAGYVDSGDLLFVQDSSELEWNGELDAGLVVEVLAFDPFEGRPMPGAVVRRSGAWDSLGVTGADGRFAARLNRHRDISLEVEVEGFLQTRWKLPLAEFDPDQVYRMPLAPCAWVEGRLYSGAAPVAGAEVDTDWMQRELPEDAAVRVAAESEPGDFRWRTPQPYGVQTDHDGRYRIALLPHPEPYRIEVQADGFGKAQSPPFPAPVAGDLVQVDLELAEQARLFGTIRRNGQAVNARVSVKSETWSFDSGADEMGSYSIEGLPPGLFTVRLQTYPSNLPNPVQPLEIWLESGEQRLLDFEWEEEITTISGTVRSRIDGFSFGHDHVRGWPMEKDPEQATYGAIENDGTFELRVPPGELFTLAVEAARLGTGRIEGVEAGAQNVEIVLDPPPFVRLSIIDPETGTALSAREVEWISWQANPEAEVDRRYAVQDPWMEKVLFLPIAEEDRNSSGKISFDLAERGYAPVVLDDVLPTNGANPGPILEVVLQPAE